MIDLIKQTGLLQLQQSVSEPEVSLSDKWSKKPMCIAGCFIIAFSHLFQQMNMRCCGYFGCQRDILVIFQVTRLLGICVYVYMSCHGCVEFHCGHILAAPHKFKWLFEG